jgi:hypothetical protein
MKNIQIMDGAENATFSIFQATDEEFALIFPRAGQDLEVVEDFVNRVGEEAAGLTLTPLWQRPIPKEDVQGIHGTLFYDWQSRANYLPPSRREVDRDAGQLNEWQRHLYDRLRTNSEK